jgi:hypothetical protein
MKAAFGALLALALAGAGPQQEPIPVGKGGKFILYEDFETTAPGQIPRGYQKTGDVAVAADASHSGRNALRISPAVNGPRRITFDDKAVLAALGPSHWGRLFFRVELPTPEPASGVIHSTLAAFTAQSPQHKDPIEVRVLDTVMGGQKKYQYIYNVQPQKRAEFGSGSGYDHTWTDEWTLAEWFVDHATQTYKLLINGKEIQGCSFSKGAGKFEGAEIPSLIERLYFGWNNYQPAGKGFVAWIDDIALGKERLGVRGIPPPAKRPAKR